MSVLVVAWLGLLELWRRRLVLLPLAVAGLTALLLGARVSINGTPLEGTALVGTVPWILATQLLPLAGELVGVLAGSGALSVEVERGTALLLATKVPRWGIVLGKALGVYAFVAGSFLLWTAILVVGWLLEGHRAEVGTLAAAGMLGVLPALLAATLSLAISARGSAQAAIVGVLVAFMARGLAGTLVATNVLVDRPVWSWLAKGIAALLPTDRLGEIGTAVALARPLESLQWWALVTPFVWLALAIALFARRDMAH